MTSALAGKRIGVTAARKADEQIEALRRRGAEVLHAPSVEYVGLDEDPRLRASTAEVLATGADTVVITTGMGLRGWLRAAEGWGMRAELVALLDRARIVARGPKAAGAVREAGLREDYTPASETDAELLEHLLGTRPSGARLVLQAHGEPLPGLTEPLREAGARVTELLPYRWQVPEHTEPLRALLDEAAAGRLDAVTFTSAPAALAYVRVGGPEAVREAFARTLVCCVGPVTARPLAELDVPHVMPERARTGALIKLVTEKLAEPSGVR